MGGHPFDDSSKAVDFRMCPGCRNLSVLHPLVCAVWIIITICAATSGAQFRAACFVATRFQLRRRPGFAGRPVPLGRSFVASLKAMRPPSFAPSLSERGQFPHEMLSGADCLGIWPALTLAHGAASVLAAGRKACRPQHRKCQALSPRPELAFPDQGKQFLPRELTSSHICSFR